MANHIAEVAKMLGVKIGETFKLTDDTHGDYHQYYQFTDKKGFETSLDGVKWKTAAAEVLKDILMGDIRIVKLPWKPKMYEKYYIPSIFDWDFYKYMTKIFTNEGLFLKLRKKLLKCPRKCWLWQRKEEI